MTTFIEGVIAKAKQGNKTIVLPEGEDIRVLEAAYLLTKDKIAKIVLLGDETEISKTFGDDVPLVVPEVNPEDVKLGKGIIANPNCSTIQAVVALKPLYDAFGIKRIVYSTYQAVSGAGVQGYNDLKDGINGVPPKKFPHPIAYNMLPHIDVFMDDGYTKEEWKMIVETRKILHDSNLQITATTVRVPVFYGHCESINVEFVQNCTKSDIVKVLEKADGIVVMDDPKNNVYPTPLIAQNHDEVYVGRIRKDNSVFSGANLWVVADNIRKGAATNAVQIVELLIKNALNR